MLAPQKTVDNIQPSARCPHTALTISKFSSMDHSFNMPCVPPAVLAQSPSAPGLLGVVPAWPPPCGQAHSCSPFITLTSRRDPINHNASFANVISLSCILPGRETCCPAVSGSRGQQPTPRRSTAGLLSLSYGPRG